MSHLLEYKIQESSPEYGYAFEHFVILEILKRVKRDFVNYNNVSVSYFMTKDNVEIDLILENVYFKNEFIDTSVNNELPNISPKNFCIEIKSAKMVQEEHLKKFARLKSDFENFTFIVLSNERYPRKYNDILIFPWDAGINHIFGPVATT